MIGRAVLSPCGRYRYSLTRTWDPLYAARRALFVMLNPSTADASVDDPTIRRCIAFAKAHNCGGLEVVNLYALRATDPARLRTEVDPVGPLNDTAIHEAADTLDNAIVIAAWGASGPHRERERRVLDILCASGRVLCLGMTKSGAPRHPLYVRGDAPLIDYPSGAR